MAAAAARSGDVCLFTDRAASYLPVDCTQHCLFGYATAVLENKEIYILIKYDVDDDDDDDDGGDGQSSGGWGLRNMIRIRNGAFDQFSCLQMVSRFVARFNQACR